MQFATIGEALELYIPAPSRLLWLLVMMHRAIVGDASEQ